MTKIIAHLVDDLSAGGVTRMLEHLTSCVGPDARFRHEIIPVRRGAFAAPAVAAEVIVSHLSISWRSFPMLVSLRASHAGARLIHVEHSYSEAFVAENVRAKARFATLLRASYALFDQIAAVSRAQGDWLVSEGLAAEGAVAVIPPAVDLSAFLALPPAGATGARRIGAIGRFDRQKGFDLLIEAFRAGAHAVAELRLYGDGPEAARLMTLAAGDPRITFHGFAADPAAAMAECDIVAMPSRWEPYGLVGLEARAAGRPLLAAPVDGLRDQVAEGAVAAGPGVDGWASAFAGLPAVDFGARISAARRAAADHGRRFAGAWTALLGADATTDEARAA